MSSQTNVNKYENQLLPGQAEIYNLCFGFMASLAVRSIIELHIVDIIHLHAKGEGVEAMSVAQIASKIDPPYVSVASLERVMRFLGRKKLFTVTYDQQAGEPLYGLTPTSKWLLRDNEPNFVTTFLGITHPFSVAMWHQMSRSIQQGGTQYNETANDETFWDKSKETDSNIHAFNSFMASTSRFMLNGILKGYEHELKNLEGTLIDVGGGLGEAVAEIVKVHPNIKGINFDLPHVVSNAPSYPGVTHVGGSFFDDIPEASNLFIKTVLHDWEDEDCIKILKNCKKAVSEKKGKIIIVDIVLQPQGKEVLDDARLAYDVQMMLVCNGKERTENDWKRLFNDSGFSHYNIIPIPAMEFVIEVFP